MSESCAVALGIWCKATEIHFTSPFHPVQTWMYISLAAFCAIDHRSSCQKPRGSPHPAFCFAEPQAHCEKRGGCTFRRLVRHSCKGQHCLWQWWRNRTHRTHQEDSGNFELNTYYITVSVLSDTCRNKKNEDSAYGIFSDYMSSDQCAGKTREFTQNVWIV